ncbi:7TM diverse intracellular signaling domain-containing protein [Echinicola pacifica]|uniref:7TM diverse intracellular signaling domain-containing protein n=1 Tax=Echinicola pacifica TaxID=346377 RepID=UPI000381D5E3|nr:7TM diverse intracellular signaling domain-containing protein [Echinicola pacifica]
MLIARKLLLVPCLILFCLQVNAGDARTFQITDQEDYDDIILSMDFMVDPRNDLNITEVSSSEFAGQFKPITYINILYDSLDHDIWLRFKVSNQSQNPARSWYFESWGFDINQFTFFFPAADGRYIANTSGYDYPFFQRNITHKNFNYFLDLRPGETKTYYFKVRRDYPLAFNFHLRTNEKFISHSLNEYYLLGIYYGVLLLILVFNIYLVYKLRDTLYLYFAGLILACIWFSLGRDGLAFQYLWPNSPSFNPLTEGRITQLMVVVATLLFSNRFVQKYNTNPKMLKLTLLAIGLKVILFFLQDRWIHIDGLVYIALTIFIMLIPFSMGLWLLIKARIYSWSYLFAYACLILVIINSYAIIIALFEDQVINWYFVHPVIFLEVVLFSLSIFNQIKFLQEQYKMVSEEKTQALIEKNRLSDELNNKLQEKVRERTEKIENMASDLASKNIELQTTNLKLQELNVQVNQINDFLRKNNEQLKTNMEEVTKNLALMKGLDFESFKNVFPDKDSCLQFLSELKWRHKFQCKKCGYNKYAAGPNHGRRCKNCNYYESPTVETLFHKLKFPIEKAFYILYLSNRKDVDLTLNELSDILELRRETCWAFKNKISQAMEKVDHNKDLSGWENLALVHLEG